MEQAYERCTALDVGVCVERETCNDHLVAPIPTNKSLTDIVECAYDEAIICPLRSELAPKPA